jgi:hypothetical protein
MAALEDSKRGMNAMMEKYLGNNMIRKAGEIHHNLDFQHGQNTGQIVTQITTNLISNSNDANNTNTPPRKYQRIQQDGTPMDDKRTLLPPLQLASITYSQRERTRRPAKICIMPARAPDEALHTLL